MRAHPVKALNLIQDSTRHRWHEATATKTALGPSANLQPSAKPWVRLAQGRMVQRDSIKRLLPRSGLPFDPRIPGSARHGGVRRCATCFSQPAWPAVCQIPDQTGVAFTRGPVERGLAGLSASRTSRPASVEPISTTRFERPTTLSDAIADREITGRNRDLLAQVAEQASTRQDRFPSRR